LRYSEYSHIRFAIEIDSLGAQTTPLMPLSGPTGSVFGFSWIDKPFAKVDLAILSLRLGSA